MSTNWRSCCAMRSCTCRRRMARRCGCGCRRGSCRSRIARIDPAAVIAGAHWVVPPAVGARIAIAYQGPVAIEAEAAFAELAAEEPGAGLLAITSPDRLHAGWTTALRARRAGQRGARAHIEDVLAPLAPGAALVTVLDGHPATHAWLGVGARPARGAAGAGSFRPGRRYSGFVPGIRDGYRRDPGCLRAGIGGVAPASYTSPARGKGRSAQRSG